MLSSIALKEQVKTSGGMMNTLLGGLPYAHGVQAAMDAHPELNQAQREEIGNNNVRPLATRARAIPYQLAGALGGLVGGGLLGHEIGGMVDHSSLGAGFGAIGGGALGELGGSIYGRHNEGKKLTEEDIGELSKPEAERQSTADRHPVATAVGAPLTGAAVTGDFLASPLTTTGKTLLAPKTAEVEKEAAISPTSAGIATPSAYTAHIGVEEAAREEGVNPNKIRGTGFRNLPLNLAGVLVPTATAIGGGLLGEHFGPDVGVSPIVGAGGGAALGSALSVPLIHHMGKMVGKARIRQLEEGQ